MTSRRFYGKKALVTDGSRGFGKAIVKALLDEGADVFALAKSKENLDKLKSEMPEVNILEADVSNWELTRNVVEQIGVVDLLVNNAGMGPPQTTFVDTDKDTFDNVLDVNFKAAFNITQVVASGLVSAGRPGAIVNMSSMATKIGYPKIMAYAVSKEMLDMLTKCTAVELGPHKIRVNNVNPTFVKTDMTQCFFSVEGMPESFLKIHPLGQYPEIKDVVDATLFLLSDQASMITGSCICIDSGLHLT